MKIGEMLKKLRLESRLTMEQLGSRLDPPVQNSTILRWENGSIRSIKAEYLNQLGQIFNISMNRLLGTDESLLKEVKLWDSITLMFGSDASEFFHDFLELNSEGKKKARSQMSDLWKLYHKEDK